MRNIVDSINEQLNEDSKWTWLFYNTRSTAAPGWWRGDEYGVVDDKSYTATQIIIVSTTGGADKAYELAEKAFQKKYGESAGTLYQMCNSQGDPQQAKDIKKLGQLIDNKGITIEQIKVAKSKIQWDDAYMGSKLYNALK